jgi:hypothetical protein
VGYQLRGAGVTMRRGGPPSHPASTQQIRELRDQGLTWNEVAKQVGMTVSGAWSRFLWIERSFLSGMALSRSSFHAFVSVRFLGFLAVAQNSQLPALRS